MRKSNIEILTKRRTNKLTNQTKTHELEGREREREKKKKNNNLALNRKIQTFYKSYKNKPN